MDQQARARPNLTSGPAAATARAGVPLAGLTTLRVGGPAARLVEAASAGEIAAIVDGCDGAGEPLLVLGGGSNLLIADEGFAGTVCRVTSRGTAAAEDGAHMLLTVAAGEPWDELVARTVSEGWAGIEALAGIPGLTGATPIQNVGAYGQEVAEVIAAVEVWDRKRREHRTLARGECGFAYRDSLFKRAAGRYVVTAVRFRFVREGTGSPVRYAELARALGVAVGDTAPIAAVREAVLALRRSKGMVLDPADHDTWSAGSFFTNPILSEAIAAAVLPDDAPRYPAGEGTVKTSAAWLIEAAGFAKGHGSGPARLSTRHTLALTNRGAATAADLLALAREVRDGVADRFGIILDHEPVLLGLEL